MVVFLSDEWIAAFDEAIRQAPVATEGEPSPDVVIGHVVTGVPGTGAHAAPDGRDDHGGPPGQRVEYRVELSPDGNAVRRGRASAPTVTFTSDYATAAAVSRGDVQTQAVFLDGRLQVSGDTAALLAASGSLARVGDVAGALRERTTYPATEPEERRA